MTFKDRRFCADVFQFIAHHELIHPQKRYLLAVSGGLDSMVLLDFFRRFAHRRYGCDFLVAHLDHALRPESAAQAAELQAYCEAQQIPIVSLRREPVASASESSLESRARQTRYAWFSELMQAEHCYGVFTAHHAQDQAETVLMKWLRGSIGLVGMRPERHSPPLRVLRPFLGLSRSQLEQYHAHHRLLCFEDASNQSLDFLRNRVRHEILPWFHQENPRWEQDLTDHLEILHAEHDYLAEVAQAYYRQCVHETEQGIVLELTVFLSLHLAVQRQVLKVLLTHLHGEWKRFSLKHMHALLALTTAQGGKRLELPFGVQVAKQGQVLFFKKTAL